MVNYAIHSLTFERWLNLMVLQLFYGKPVISIVGVVHSCVCSTNVPQVYLLIIFIVDIYFGDTYCSNMFSWLTSDPCAFIGVFSTFGKLSIITKWLNFLISEYDKSLLTIYMSDSKLKYTIAAH